MRFEIILRAEHIEIALRDALHQVLLCGLIVRLGLRDLRIRALQRLPVLPAKQTLLEVNGVLVNGGIDLAAEREGFGHRRGRTCRSTGLAGRYSGTAGGQGERLGLVDGPRVAFARDFGVTGQLGQQR